MLLEIKSFELKSANNLIRRGIEVVITGLTRNQFVAQAAREFESHRLRQKGAMKKMHQQETRLLSGFLSVFIENKSSFIL